MADRFSRRKKEKQQDAFFDYTLLFIVLFLLGFGLIMLYSTSSYEANLEHHDAAYYLKKQLSASILGLIVMMVVANIPYHFWERFAALGYGVLPQRSKISAAPLSYGTITSVVFSSNT